MAGGTLTIDLGAIAQNFRALDAMSAAETGAVVKADAYGLGLEPVGKALRKAGANRFFVAIAEEGAALRKILGPGPEIAVFSGHMDGDTGLIRDNALTPMLNSPEQWARHRETGLTYGVQLDSGMSRLGFQPGDWAECRDEMAPNLIMSHLACADEPEHRQNAAQLTAFRALTEGATAPLSLAATGGTLIGPDYHFDLTRPGIGVYGGMPFAEARPVVRLSLPVIQVRDLAPGDTVGYGATFTAARPSRIATVSGGYADGLIRAMSGRGALWHGETACPIAGRVSMDLIGVDITDLNETPERLDILAPHQGIDDLAEGAGTIGYEILTSLGARYTRTYLA
ncbi:MAG: alanine racemase [Pseudomonadota bacterium]